MTPADIAADGPALSVFRDRAEVSRTTEDAITAHQLEAIETFHQASAKRFSAALTELTQQTVEVQLQSVECETYSKFTFSRPVPTCFVTVSAATLKDRLAVDYAPVTFYSLFHCLLGGGRGDMPIPDRPLTLIEKRLARRITQVLLGELHDSWEHVLAVDLQIDQVDSHAQRVRLVNPSDPVIVLTFRLRVLGRTGNLTLCLPLNAVRKMVAKLTGPIDSAKTVKMTATLGPILIDRKIDLEPGELFITDLDAGTLATVSIDGRPAFTAKPASLAGRKALVVEQEEVLTVKAED